MKEFHNKLKIENYSDQTIRNYMSALKLFLEYVSKVCVKKLTDKEIKDYLFYCKTKKNYSYSSMKQVIATIRYLYRKVLKISDPEVLDIELRKPSTLPCILSIKDISVILDVTKNCFTINFIQEFITVIVFQLANPYINQNLRKKCL